MTSEDLVLAVLVHKQLLRKWRTRRNNKIRSPKARRLREELVKRLGGRCAECDETNEALLHIDHIFGKDWEANKLTALARVQRYWRELEEGVPLQVLCKFCNGSKNQYALYGGNREPGSDG